MENSAFAPKVTFNKEEEKFIKNITSTNNTAIVEEVLKEQGIDISPKKDDKEFPENVLKHNCELKSFEQTVKINPNTGEQTPISAKDIKEDINAINVDIDKIEDTNLSDITLGDEFEEKFSGMYGMDLQSAKSFLSLLRDYRDKKVTTNLFNKLPKQLQILCRGLCSDQNIVPKLEMLNIMAKELLDSAIADAGIDNAYIDIEKGINEAFDEFYSEIKKEGKKLVEKEDYEYGEKIETILKYVIEKNPEKIEFIEYWTKAKSIYNDATTFASIKLDLINNEHCSRRLDKHVKRYKKYLHDFMYKYDNKTKPTKYGCPDINAAVNTLARHLDQNEYSNEDILKFFVLICRHTLNYDATNYHDNLYMYFTVKSILRLETLEIKDEKYISILHSIKEIIDLIKGGK